MTRTCWKCPNPATNTEDALIPICNECFSNIQNLIERKANEGFQLEPWCVNPKEYGRLMCSNPREITISSCILCRFLLDKQGRCRNSECFCYSGDEQ